MALLVQLARQERQVTRALSDLRDPLVLRERQAALVLPVLLAPLVLPVLFLLSPALLVPLVPRVKRALSARRGQLALLVPRVRLDR